MTENNLNDFLERVGLTEYEAKTLKSLLQLKESQAPQISRDAQVPKTRVYDVLERLTKKGLIIEVYGRPKKYRVIEPSKVFDKLIEERKQEIKKLEQKAAIFKKNVSDEVSSSQGEKVMKVRDKKDFLRILSQEIVHTKKSLMVFAKHSKDYSLVSQAIKKLSEKKIDIRIMPSTVSSNENFLDKLKETTLNLKLADHGLDAYVMDNKKVILALSNLSEDQGEYHFIIWPNHPHMANALQHYFNILWERGKKI